MLTSFGGIINVNISNYFVSPIIGTEVISILQVVSKKGSLEIFNAIANEGKIEYQTLQSLKWI
jgi:hypothetical protein